MVLIPKSSVENEINDLIEKDHVKSFPREYMGYSELGDVCSRRVWYNFRWCNLNSIIPKMQRLFSRGDWEEERIISDLRQIGITVFGQQKTVYGLAGHIQGHIDGLLEDVPGLDKKEIVLLEIKTANQKNFDKFKKDNDILKTNQKYYSQAQSYMGKLKLNKTLFCVTNKNTEDRWFKIIDFDIDAFEKIESLAASILMTDTPPLRIGGSTWYQCKYCNFKQICHFKKKPLKSCRSCQYGTIEDKCEWSCGLTNEKLTVEKQQKGCDKYQLLDTLKNE